MFNSSSARRLIWVPVVHTPADLGSMSATIQQLYDRQLGEGKWDHRVQAVADMWRQIEREIELLQLDYARVRLYQDGLPNSGHETDIVRDLARAGSLNHRLLLKLMAKGAQLMGTESPELLLEEYELARHMLVLLSSGKSSTGKSGTAANYQQERHQQLLERRDRHIAQRINDTLLAGETGLIFLGMLHALEGRLAQDIELSRLGQRCPKEDDQSYHTNNIGGSCCGQDKSPHEGPDHGR